MISEIISGVILLLALFVLSKALIIVHQAEVAVIERFGRFHRVLPSGLSIRIPLVDTIRSRVDMREQFITVPPQPVITKDNVTIAVDNVLYYQATDPQLSVYGVTNFAGAIENLVQTTLRSIIGEMTLDETLSNREMINAKLMEKMERETVPWGVKVHRIEIKQIETPREIKEAMEKQMRAERDKRAQITLAEAEKQSQILQAEGYQTATVTRAGAERQKAILEAQGEAEALLTVRNAEARGLAMLREAGADSAVLTLKALEALVQVAQGQSTTLVVPTELASVAGTLSTLTQVVKTTASGGPPALVVEGN